MLAPCPRLACTPQAPLWRTMRSNATRLVCTGSCSSKTCGPRRAIALYCEFIKQGAD